MFFECVHSSSMLFSTTPFCILARELTKGSCYLTVTMYEFWEIISHAKKPLQTMLVFWGRHLADGLGLFWVSLTPLTVGRWSLRLWDLGSAAYWWLWHVVCRVPHKKSTRREESQIKMSSMTISYGCPEKICSMHLWKTSLPAEILNGIRKICTFRMGS